MIDFKTLVLVGVQNSMVPGLFLRKVLWVIRKGSFRRLPHAQRSDNELLSKSVCTPWTLVPSDAAAHELLVTLRVDVAPVVDAGVLLGAHRAPVEARHDEISGDVAKSSNSVLQEKMQDRCGS